MSEAIGNDQKMLQACQRAMEEIARSFSLTKLEQDQLKRFISRQSGMKLNMSKMDSQISLLRTTRFLPLFLVQFFGAFNDNLLKTVLVVLIAYGLWDIGGWDPAVLVAVAAGLFILPFILLCPFAGNLSDKYDKAVMIRWVKRAEIVIALLAVGALYSDNLYYAFFVLLLLGAQSAFFSPCKFAILPQYLFRIVKLCMKTDEGIPDSWYPNETSVRRHGLFPAVDKWFEVIAVIAAVPENLRNLDLVRPAHCGLCRRQPGVVCSFRELPVAVGVCGFCLCQDDWLILGLHVLFFRSRLCCKALASLLLTI